MATIASQESSRGFLLARGTRIFPPYWVYTGVVLIVSLIAPSIVNSSFNHPPSLWRSFLLVPDTVDPLLAVGWTLTHEVYFYLVFAALLATGCVRFVSLCVWAVIVIAVPLVLRILPSQETSPILAVMLHPLTVEFIAGACVGLAIRSGNTIRPWSFVVIGAIALVGVLSASHDPSQLVIDHTARWTRVWKIGLPFALIVYGMAGSEIKGGVRHIPGWMIHLGNASYSIYLTHVLVLSAIGRCFALIPVHNFSIEGLFVLFCVIGTNGVGLLSYRLVERPTLRISRDLFSKAETRKQRVS